MHSIVKKCIINKCSQSNSRKLCLTKNKKVTEKKETKSERDFGKNGVAFGSTDLWPYSLGEGPRILASTVPFRPAFDWAFAMIRSRLEARSKAHPGGGHEGLGQAGVLAENVTLHHLDTVLGAERAA